MNEYLHFPPYDNFKRTLISSPNSALLYASLWRIKPVSNSLLIRKNDVKKRFFISPTVFRNHLLSLGRIGLLSCEDKGEYIHIDFSEKYENQ